MNTDQKTIRELHEDEQWEAVVADVKEMHRRYVRGMTWWERMRVRWVLLKADIAWRLYR